jgi:hypothetical protein
MAFGRRSGKDDSEDTSAGPTGDDPVKTPLDTQASAEQPDEEVEGPFDIEDFDDPAVAELARLDLGSVLIPMPEAGQLQVELTETGVPSAVWVVTPNGRFTIAAYAAPKTGSLWREVAGELADSLRKDSAEVSIKDGPWGREVIGTASGVVRFIGVDGYRWPIPWFAAVTPPCRCGRRWPCSCPSRWPTSYVRPPCSRPRRNRRPPNKPTHKPTRKGRPTSRQRAAARRDRPCSNCAPPPAASPAWNGYASASAARQADPSVALSAPI